MKMMHVLRRLFVLSISFIPMLILTIIFGLFGFVSAHLITILAAVTIFKTMGMTIALSYPTLFAFMIISGILRGFLRYAEHLTGHYTAFKMLANIRSLIFQKLRLLAPARLEDKEKGDLVSLITSDIEMLEIFYAHTIAPVMIFILHTVLVVTTFILLGAWPLALVAFFLYLTNGIIIPLTKGKKTKLYAENYRTHYSAYAASFMDEIYGTKDLISLGAIARENAALVTYTDEVEAENKAFKFAFARLRAISDFLIYTLMGLFLALSIYLYSVHFISEYILILSLVLISGSFGPSLALNNLPSTLSHTLAAGERILSFLDETPEVVPQTTGEDFSYESASLVHVSFKYADETVLNDVSLNFEKNKIYGILGESGSGKSTILKLLMRFWDPQVGEVKLNNINIKNLNTNAIFANIAYMTQDTYIFNTTIRENIVLDKEVSDDRLNEVISQSALTTFINTLEKGLETNAGELGARLSGGERQRIGLARLLLHGGSLVLLDEPTSNVDALSEAEIISALAKLRDNHTVILVSHRPSTLKIADEIINIKDGVIIK